MKVVKKKLNEGLIVYQDVNSGEQYIWDGSQYTSYKDWLKTQPDQSAGGSSSKQQDDSSNQQQSNSKSQPQKQPPNIGDKGDADIQAAEDKARQEQIEQEAQATQDAAKAAKEATDNTGDPDADAVSDDMADVEKSASEIKKDLKDAAKKGDKISPQTIDDLEERVKKIQDAFNDSMTQAKIVSETTNKVDKEKLDKAAEEMRRFRESPINRFKDSLNKFIAKETAVGRSPTWKRFNKTYANSPIIKPGRTRGEKGKIPLINVYFDRSGSWDDAKTASGMQAIGTLNKYVQRGEIKIEIYYFSNNVHKSKSAAEAEGSTYGQPIMDHINQTKPDNVIIMTDSDISDIKTPTTVPGAVWLLFKGGVSENLIDNIHGKKQTKVMYI
jgi:hypothetical protein